MLTASPLGDDPVSMSTAAGSPRTSSSAWHRRLGTWLASSLGERCDATWQRLNPSTRRQAALLDARTAFRAAIDDIPRPPGGAGTLEHIRGARSLEALWELRSELYSLISCHHDQGEATRRIAALDLHFSRRRCSAASRRPAHRRAR